MTVKSFVCLICGDILYSRAIYDTRSCHCGNITVYGDPDQPNILMERNAQFKYNLIDLPITPEQLYDDWNFLTDNFGIESEHV